MGRQTTTSAIPFSFEFDSLIAHLLGPAVSSLMMNLPMYYDSLGRIAAGGVLIALFFRYLAPP